MNRTGTAVNATTMRTALESDDIDALAGDAQHGTMQWGKPIPVPVDVGAGDADAADRLVALMTQDLATFGVRNGEGELGSLNRSGERPFDFFA